MPDSWEGPGMPSGEPQYFMFSQWPDPHSTYYLFTSPKRQANGDWFWAKRISCFCSIQILYLFFLSICFSESSLVLNISHDCFLTVISFQIYYWMLLCMCLMLKELFVMTIMCFCWIFTVVFNNHETCTGTAFWNLKFSAKIINILNNKVKIYRPIEILNKLVSIFNLVKNSRKVSTDIFLGLFLVYEKNGNVAFKWYMQSTGSVAMSKLQQTSKTLWTFL